MDEALRFLQDLGEAASDQVQPIPVVPERLPLDLGVEARQSPDIGDVLGRWAISFMSSRP